MSFGPIMQFDVGELRIELAPLSKDVMGEFIKPGMNQLSVSRYLGNHTAYVVEDEESWFEKTRLDKTVIVWGIWIVDGENRQLIGNSALTDITHGHIRQATSGSLIFRKEYWGKGIASAAHKARTWYAFHELGLHRIMSAVIQANGGSLKALQRSGYNHVYVERNTLFTDGQLHHQYNVECLNPSDPFWSQWWHGDRPAQRAVDARPLTIEALAWAKEHVELL